LIGIDPLTLTTFLTFSAKARARCRTRCIKLDDAGYLLMRNGWYRLSEAYKAGKL
jgi:hypothetical protein